MKINLCLLLILCFLIIGGAGCTKEKALALQDVSSKLVKASEEAVLGVEKWWSSVSPSSADLTGNTIDLMASDYAETLVGADTTPSFTIVNTEINEMIDSFSKDKKLEPLMTLKEAIFQINLAVKDLDKGHYFASKAVKDLTHYLKLAFKSLVMLATDLDDYVVTEKELDPKIISLQEIWEEKAVDDGVKQLRMAVPVRNIIDLKLKSKKLNDEMITSLVIAAKYAMDMLEKADNYGNLSVKDILSIANRWKHLATKLSGGELSQSEIDKVLENVRVYARKMRLIDAEDLKVKIEGKKTGDEKGAKAEKVVEENKTEAEAKEDKSKTEINAGNKAPVLPSL